MNKRKPKPDAQPLEPDDEQPDQDESGRTSGPQDATGTTSSKSNPHPPRVTAAADPDDADGDDADDSGLDDDTDDDADDDAAEPDATPQKQLPKQK